MEEELRELLNENPPEIFIYYSSFGKRRSELHRERKWLGAVRHRNQDIDQIEHFRYVRQMLNELYSLERRVESRYDRADIYIHKQAGPRRQ